MHLQILQIICLQNVTPSSLLKPQSLVEPQPQPQPQPQP